MRVEAKRRDVPPINADTLLSINADTTHDKAPGFLPPVPMDGSSGPAMMLGGMSVMQVVQSGIDHPSTTILFMAVLISGFAHVLRHLPLLYKVARQLTVGKTSKSQKEQSGKTARSFQKGLAPWDSEAEAFAVYSRKVEKETSGRPECEQALLQEDPACANQRGIWAILPQFASTNAAFENMDIVSPETTALQHTGSQEIRELLPGPQPSLITSYLAYVAILALAVVLSVLLLTSSCPDFLITVLPWIVISICTVAMIVSPLSYWSHLNRLSLAESNLGQKSVWPLSHIVVLISQGMQTHKLEEAFQAITQQTGTGLRPHVVLAVNPNDESPEEAVASLRKTAGNQISRLQLLHHSLTADDIQARPLSRSRLARKLYQQFVVKEKLDPFRIMVTFVSADSILSDDYLANVEEHFNKLPDGHRTVFSSSMNTYRSLANGGILSQMYDLMRCHESTFFNPALQFVPQVNYSMTLGFASELNRWTSKPSGAETACHALQYFGNISTEPIEALVYTDLAQSFGKRYESAKLQQWAAVECAWQSPILKCIPTRLRETWTTLKAALVQELAIFTCAMQCCIFFIKVAGFFLVPLLWRMELPGSLATALEVVLTLYCWQWTCFWVVEGMFWIRFLRSSPIVGPSIGRWVLIMACSPILWLATQFIFVIVPSIHCLITAAIWGMSNYRSPRTKASR